MKFTTGALSFPSKIGNHHHWTGVSGCAQAMCLAELVQNEPNLIVAITANAADYHRIAREAQYFIGDRSPTLTLPNWETLAYDRFSPHEDITSERIRTLSVLPNTKKGLIIVPIHTLMQRLMPYSALQALSFAMSIGQRLDNHGFATQLTETGYQSTDTVYNPGEFVIRGAVIDIFPMGSPLPYRIERFDDEIESIRAFDPESQRTINKVDQIALLPARECPLDQTSIKRFKNQFEDVFPINPTQCPLYQDIKDGIPSAGMEYYLPLFYESTSTLFDYLPQTSLLVTMPGLNQVMDNTWREWHLRYEDRRHDKYHPILPPKQLIIAADEVNQAFKKMRRITLHEDSEFDTAATSHSNFIKIPPVTIESKKDDPVAHLRAFLANKADENKPVFIAAESTGRREGLHDLLGKHDIPTQLIDHIEQLPSERGTYLGIAPLDVGIETQAFAIIAEAQLFGERVMQRRRRTTRDDSEEMAIRSLLELSVGDPVVHLEHGVGRYLGLQTLELDNQQQEFLALEYADEAKLYVPVADLHQIARYTAADPALVPLHKLGSDQWSKAKQKAVEKIHDIAAELLSIYARRAAQRGVAFDIPESDYDRFCQQFPFEETPDQAAAIDAVLKDLEGTQPMDRLVCGDVGFGKTEVAMRAAFVAVNNDKQVAVLVPTTLLAQQHFESFRDRFADWPVKIELLSRFRTAKQICATLEAMANGNADILVGTHKLLQKSVEFKRLGLIIVDEEHRFGVKHKEQLKNLRANVDLLTLTATPIPRTLNMAFSGIRDLSIIATPPAKRLSVKTFVREDNVALVKEAILRELLRGGQVYYLHNEVKTIEQTSSNLTKLVPEARVVVAHGQMPERALESVMSDFYHKKFNVLVCSTIIESGIDIPNANTIIIDRADTFGLAQLHQLRGRVGRSHHQAYAYLLVPSLKAVTSDAQKRLEVIENADHLGAGFTLASHDLEIRGAGELLGSEQSGHINAIGYTLYMDMLNRAVKSIKSGNTPSLEQPLELNTVVNLRVPALIPDDYLPDVHNRLVMYKRISSADTQSALDQLKVEMIDRFGLLPDPVKRLFRQTQLKLQAKSIGIKKIEANAQSAYLEIDEKTSIEPLKLVKLVQTRPNEYKLVGATGLKYIHNKTNFSERLEAVETLLQHLSSY